MSISRDIVVEISAFEERINYSFKEFPANLGISQNTFSCILLVKFIIPYIQK